MPDETEFLDETDKRKEIISDSDLALYSVCPYAFYLNRLEGKTKIPTSGAAAAVIFFLSKRKKLFEVRDPRVGHLFKPQRRAGPELKPIEKMSRAELAEYMPSSSPEAFGNSLKATWTRILDRDMYQGNPIYWNYANEPWKISNDLKKAGENYFEFVLDQGVPIMGLVDKERTFMFEGVQLRVKIPEIRIRNNRRSGEEGYRVFIDKPTLFDFKGEWSGKSRAGLDLSSIVTLNLFGVSKLLKKYPGYLEKLDAPFWFYDIVEEDKTEILPHLAFRHISLIGNKTKIGMRYDSNLDELRRLIENHVENVAEERFEPNKKACVSCRYNILGVDGREVCEYRNRNLTPSVPRHYFDSKKFRIEETDGGLEGTVEREKKIIVRNKIKTIVSSHQVCHYDFEIQGDRVVSSYNSRAFGVVFSAKKQGSMETQMIEALGSRIQGIADREGRVLVHEADFSDFDFAGKKRVKEKFDLLGYEKLEDGNFRKEYAPVK